MWSWTIKKTEHRQIGAFKPWCWRTLESPLDCRNIKLVSLKGKQPWVFIGRTDAKIEAPILWPCDAKSWLIGKDPDAGKHWGQEERGQQRMSSFDNIINSMDTCLSKLQERMKSRDAWSAAVHMVTNCWTQLSDWTTTNSWKIGQILIYI